MWTVTAGTAAATSGRDRKRCLTRRALTTICAALFAAGLLAPTSSAEPKLRIAWGAATSTAAGDSAKEATYRAIIRSTISGDAVRVRFSNALGSSPLTFSSASIGLRAPEFTDGRVRGAAVVPGTGRRLTFGGQAGITIPQGRTAYSDVVPLDVAAQQDLAVSLYVRDAQPVTAHSDDLRAVAARPGFIESPTQYVTGAGAGDRTGDERASAYEARGTDMFWADAVDVRSNASGAVVALGDSITEGASTGASAANGARADAYDRYPDVLGRRLAELPSHETASAVNEGIGGNNIAQVDARLERDVLSQTGVTHVILLIGTNDLTQGRTSLEVIGGIRAITQRLRTAGIKVIGGTILPREPSSTPAINLYRHQVNDFIRTSDLFAGVADFDLIVHDANDPERMRADYTDEAIGLHPNPRGYAAMGNGIDLGMLTAFPSNASDRAGSTAPAEIRTTSGGRPQPRRVRPRFVRARTLGRRIGRGVRLNTAGRLGPPVGVTRRQACRSGVVAVHVKARRSTISARRVRLRGDCSFRSSVTFGALRRLLGAGRLVVTVRFAGNGSLLPRHARPLAVRFHHR